MQHGLLIHQTGLNRLHVFHPASARRKPWADLIRDTGAAPHLVNLLKAKGSSDPVGEAAAMLDALPEFVAAHYEHFENAVASGEKRRRDREIVRLARHPYEQGNHGPHRPVSAPDTAHTQGRRSGRLCALARSNNQTPVFGHVLLLKYKCSDSKAQHRIRK